MTELREPFAQLVKAMEGLKPAAGAAGKAMRGFVIAHQMSVQYQEQLVAALADQRDKARDRRNAHWVSLAFGIVLSFLMFAWLETRGTTSLWAYVLVSLATGWFILKDLYWATHWDNYGQEVEETIVVMERG